MTNRSISLPNFLCAILLFFSSEFWNITSSLGFSFLLCQLVVCITCILAGILLLLEKRLDQPNLSIGICFIWAAAFQFQYNWSLTYAFIKLSDSFPDMGLLLLNPFFFQALFSLLFIPAIFGCAAASILFGKKSFVGFILCSVYLITLFFIAIPLLMKGELLPRLLNILSSAAIPVGMLLWFYASSHSETVSEGFCPRCNATAANSEYCPLCYGRLQLQQNSFTFPNEPIRSLSILSFCSPIVGFILFACLRKRAPLCARRIVLWSIISMLPFRVLLLIWMLL